MLPRFCCCGWFDAPSRPGVSTLVPAIRTSYPPPHRFVLEGFTQFLLVVLSGTPFIFLLWDCRGGCRVKCPSDVTPVFAKCGLAALTVAIPHLDSTCYQSNSDRQEQRRQASYFLHWHEGQADQCRIYREGCTHHQTLHWQRRPTLHRQLHYDTQHQHTHSLCVCSLGLSTSPTRPEGKLNLSSTSLARAYGEACPLTMARGVLVVPHTLERGVAGMRGILVARFWSFASPSPHHRETHGIKLLHRGHTVFLRHFVPSFHTASPTTLHAIQRSSFKR